MLTAFVEGIGLCGPGLTSWGQGAPVLTGREPYMPAPPAVPTRQLLPPAERRRAAPSVRLALAVGQAAMAHSGCDASKVSTVFASSGGDGETIHAILEVLTSAQKEVSPTRFHNSVHNAASGYWAIATRCRKPSTALCAYDCGFAAGLLEAGTRVVADQEVVALIAHDQAYPKPLDFVRPIHSAFGVGLVLSPAQTERSIARLEIGLCPEAHSESAMDDPELERLRAGNPAARCLPMLRALACAKSEELVLACMWRCWLAVAVHPVECAARRS